MYNGDLVKLRAYKEEDIERAVQFINDEEVKKLLDSNVPFPMAKWQEEGRLKKEIYRNGKYHDEIVMAIFKEDFKA